MGTKIFLGVKFAKLWIWCRENPAIVADFHGTISFLPGQLQLISTDFHDLWLKMSRGTYTYANKLLDSIGKYLLIFEQINGKSRLRVE